MHWDGPNGCRCLDSQRSGGRCGRCGRCPRYPACWQPVALLLALLLLLPLLLLPCFASLCSGLLGVVVQLILGLPPSLLLQLRLLLLVLQLRLLLLVLVLVLPLPLRLLLPLLLRLLLLPPLRLLLLPLNLPASIVEACLAQPLLPSARVPVPGCCL